MSNALLDLPDEPNDDHDHFSSIDDSSDNTAVVIDVDPNQLTLIDEDEIEQHRAKPKRYKPKRDINWKSVIPWVSFTAVTLLVVNETLSLIIRHALVEKPAQTLNNIAWFAYSLLIILWIIDVVLIKLWNKHIKAYLTLSIVAFVFFIGYAYCCYW